LDVYLKALGASFCNQALNVKIEIRIEIFAPFHSLSTLLAYP